MAVKRKKAAAPAKAPAIKVGSYKVALEQKPYGAVKKLLGKGLDEHNIAEGGPYKYSEFVVGVRDLKGQARGGFLVDVFYESAFLKWAWIDKSIRRKSLGRALMKIAEDESRKRGAKNLWLDTFSFQARPFYEKLGYKVFGTLKHGREGVERYWLSKDL